MSIEPIPKYTTKEALETAIMHLRQIFLLESLVEKVSAQ